MFWTYLLLSDRGEFYTGHTGHLRKRVRSHNDSRNTGWTRGRRWHLVATREFATRGEAMAYELKVKQSCWAKDGLLVESRDRLVKLLRRHAIVLRTQRINDRLGLGLSSGDQSKRSA